MCSQEENLFATLYGYAGLAIGGMLPPGMTGVDLDDVIAHIVRGSAPSSTTAG